MIDKTTLKNLYLGKKYSAAEIAQELKSTFPKVLYWIKKYKIPIRTSSERTYFKLNRNGDPFSPKQKLNDREKDLMLLALGLYWGEGCRKSKHVVKLANLDYRILQIFIRFLRVIACVDEKRLRLDVRVFRDFDLNAARRYWSQCLNLNEQKIFVYTHTDLRSQKNEQWSPYGIATLSAHNIKLKQWLDGLLQKQAEKALPQGLPGRVHVPCRGEQHV